MKLKRPLIVGSRGAMGRRYTAVLRHLGADPALMDIDEELPQHFDSIIVATPTVSHITVVDWASHYNVPILCEKPLIADAAKAVSTCERLEKRGVGLTLVNQYAYLDVDPMVGETFYDYFNHGRDGLAWDCISIIAMANGGVTLGETSPLWSLVLNGQKVFLSEMDYAYIDMMNDWLRGAGIKELGYPYIRLAHAKVEQYLRSRL